MVAKLKSLFLSLVSTMLVVSYITWTTMNKPYPTSRNAIATENPILCDVSLKNARHQYDLHMPVIYFITPTYPRREQFAELTRLGQTLMHVPNLHWIVADDNNECNNHITNFLLQFGIPFTHLASPMPPIYRKSEHKPRGVANRRAALQWIRNNAKSGVLYFGDDDNTFDLRLFDEIRNTEKVSMFPVGLIGEFGVSSPVIQKGKIIGFFDSWPADRMFPVDMAGFAVSVNFLLEHPNATMPYKAGHEEDQFLKSLNLRLEDIEPKASSCTKILVWHTQTVKKAAHQLKIPSAGPTSLQVLLNELSTLGVIIPNNIAGLNSYMTVNGKKKKISQDGLGVVALENRNITVNKIKREAEELGCVKS